jgi:hypothetical protein
LLRKTMSEPTLFGNKDAKYFDLPSTSRSQNGQFGYLLCTINYSLLRVFFQKRVKENPLLLEYIL